ncbi:hypothetical protein G6011_04045 [Alternaria panax]|uniref:Glycoside hydrolase family 76 protein n=1 Tax=Alternaria panax TaxID=48097 RepID=A0AAD4IG44_9PLEO|nr:hypothetical protein G6011_04045 [Alternaria panax]
MLLPFFLQFLLTSGTFIPNAFAQYDLSSLLGPATQAELALISLQKWYNISTGLWESTGWWNGANIMTMIGDLAKADPGYTPLQDVASNIFAIAVVKAPAKNPQPGIENPSSNSTTLIAVNTTNVETSYEKSLDPHTGELYVTYPLDWHDNNGWIISPGTSYRHDYNYSYDPNTPDYRDWLDGYYDDDLWWALAWISAYDVTHNYTYLDLAEGIFIAVSSTWGTYCFDGGIYWSWKRDYVNAIANELFFSTAAHLANRVENDDKRTVYLAWAEKSLKWFLESGMITQDGIINDGLTENCENNNKTAWSYNQGVILGGLTELHQAIPTSDFPHLRLASHLARAALFALSDQHGVIHDECEPDCGGDGAQFKGIFMRNLAKLYSVVHDRVFANAIRTNAASIWAWDRRMTFDDLPVFSVNWAGPWVSPANASTHSSAMDAFVAAAVVQKIF